MNTRVFATAALTALMVIAAAASPAQNYGRYASRDIRVIVNGNPVQFDTIGPREINGRLLVPLRGVLEQLGAYVDWDAATQTVLADKDGTKVEIPIGSRYATVDGERIRLDVPAMTIGGSTMVPLRFLSETLGASVSWNERTNTAMISSEGGVNAETRRAYRRQNRDQEQGLGDRRMPVVESVETNFGGGMLRGGDTIHVTMRATAGGRAWFRIRGVVGERKMQETSPGVYEGSWRAPDGAEHRINRSDILAFVGVGSRSTAEKSP